MEKAMMKMLIVQFLSLVVVGCVSTSLTEYTDEERKQILIESQQLVAKLQNFQTQYHSSHLEKFDCAHIGNSRYCKSH